jgi:hypothetical protein
MNAACSSQCACCREPRPRTQAGPTENSTTVRVGIASRTGYADGDIRTKEVTLGHLSHDGRPRRRIEGERDLAGWAELRAWQDDDRLGVHVRRLRTAYEHRERALVCVQALRLLMTCRTTMRRRGICYIGLTSAWSD